MSNQDNQRVVKNIVHVDISFSIHKICSWLDSDCQESLLDVGDGIWEIPNGLTYRIEILPHPDGEGFIIYHRNINSFGNTLDAFLDFTESTYVQFPKSRGTISGIRWELHNGYLLLAISSPKHDQEKWILAAPTMEIYRLQTGNELTFLEGTASFEEYNSAGKETTITLPHDLEHLKKINRIKLGLGIAKGVGYRNALAQITAYAPSSFKY